MEMRVFNQFTESFSVLDLAEKVAAVYGNGVEIQHVEDPRVEADEHFYEATHTKLLDLGLVPHLLTDDSIQRLLSLAGRYRDRVDIRAISPTVSWRRTSSKLLTSNNTTH